MKQILDVQTDRDDPTAVHIVLHPELQKRLRRAADQFMGNINDPFHRMKLLMYLNAEIEAYLYGRNY